jgi:hypothetical protein
MKELLGALVLLGVGLGALSCTVTPAAEECERACAVASRCGLLPSALGGAVGEPSAHDEQSCVTRCIASEGDDPQLKGLLARLVEAGQPADDALCTPEGVDTCEALIESLEQDPDTSELEVTTTLTVRMINLVSHVSTDSLGSWCCFDHRYDFGVGNDVDELSAVYDMFQPTYDCLAGMQKTAIESTPETTAQDCTSVLQAWRAPPPTEAGNPATDPCTYARQIVSATTIGLPESEDDCAAMDEVSLAELGFELDGLMGQWSLALDGPLLGMDGTVRPLEDVRARFLAGTHDRLAHPGAPLEHACNQALGSSDVARCDSLDREALAEPAACESGPSCNAADCLAESPNCDPTLCDVERSPPGRDCGELGVTEVRLGYRDARGLEVLGDPIVGCEALTEVATTFEHVKVGPLTPIAAVSGALPSFLTESGASHPYSWVMSGETRWITAGAAELEMPSPLVEWVENTLQNPLEALGWVPRRLPIGKACDLESGQCEGYFSDNCDNAIDDDGDGYTDEESPWCNAIARELVARCVVAAPGRKPLCEPPAP